MSPLTADERAAAALELRGLSRMQEGPGREMRASYLCALADKLEAEPEPSYTAALERTTRILHTFGCVPDCQREDTASWVENARILLDEVVPLLPTTAERDEAREALRDLLDWYGLLGGVYPDRVPEEWRAAAKRARAVLEGVERTHALIDLTDLARAVRTIRDHANLCEGASLTDEATSHRAFADRIEVRADA
jgi:hypothetical protein